MSEIYGKLVEWSYSCFGKISPFRVQKYYRELIANQYRPLKQLRWIQWIKFQSILNHAYRQVPFYRDLLDKTGIKPRDIRQPSDIPFLPIVTREQLTAASLEKTVAAAYSKHRLIPIQTSGTSSGKPFHLLLDFDGFNRKYALLLRSYSYLNWRFGRKIMALWNEGHEDYKPFLQRSPAKSLLYALAHLKRWLPPFQGSSKITESSGWTYWSRINRYQPYLLEGDAFTLFLLGKFFSESGLKPPPVQAISCAASASTPHVRGQMAALWGAPVYNNYGPHEMEGVGCECEARSGLHQSIDAYLIEFISNGKPAGDGVLSDLVLTDLENRAMPLIRYRIGDLIRAGISTCNCGRTLPLMHDIVGRKEDALVIGQRLIPENEVQDRLSAAGITLPFQIIQQSEREFRLRLADHSPILEEKRLAAVQALRSLLGVDANIALERIDAVAAESSGKFRILKSFVQRGDV